MKLPKINGFKQEFDILSWDNEFQKIKVNDSKGKDHEALVLDPVVKNWDLSKMKRGCRLVCIASRGKIKAYGSKVITHILNVQQPIQIDLVDYINEQRA